MFQMLRFGILWRTDPFLGNDRETNNETTAVAKQEFINKQQLKYDNRGSVGNGVFCDPRCCRCKATAR
jgi:hypothetical protein